jgi:hypothetical protein
MSTTFGTTTLGKISNVRTFNGDTSTYYCHLEITEDDLPTETVHYAARQSDMAATGAWVYQQIVDGNFEGVVTNVVDGTNVFTGELIGNQALIEEQTKRRNALLEASDWTQNADIPQATKDKWAPYRQALRDVPQQAGFPKNVVWPTPPQ